jgi:hypothetical protein
MTVAIVLVAVMLIVASVISLVSCITIAIVAAIGGNDATRGDEQKSGNGAVSGKALERTHKSLQWVGEN